MNGADRLKTGLKRATKKCLAHLSTGIGDSSNGGSRVLTYHSVGDRDHEMNVTPESFRLQMQWLHDHRTVVPVQKLIEGADGIAITFDDGYRDNLTHAAPVLEEMGFTATVFAVPGRMGETLDHDIPKDCSRIMTWDELRAWEAKGFETGGHTLNHKRLSLLSASEQRVEIKGCKEMLEEQLGHDIISFAYPFGSMLDYRDESQHIVRESGFHYAFSNRYGCLRLEEDAWELRRIWIDRSDDMESFIAKVDGKLDTLSVLDSRAGMWCRRLLNRLLSVR